MEIEILCFAVLQIENDFEIISNWHQRFLYSVCTVREFFQNF
jgi:hypothetical protein